MKTIFIDDFSFYDENKKPYNILIEKDSDFSHLHSTVRDNGYCILLTGNKHLANTPQLKNFKIKFKCKKQLGDPGKEMQPAVVTAVATQKKRIFGFTIFFRYDRFTRSGYALTCSFGSKLIFIDLNVLNFHQKKTIKRIEIPISGQMNNSDIDVSMEAKENKFKIKLNDRQIEIIDEHRSFQSHGYIGLDRTSFTGELVVNELHISSNEALNKEEVQSPIIYDLPCVNGMSVPYRFTLNLYKYENGPYELDIKLSGGIKERPDRGKCGGQWCYEVDKMKNPYLRIETYKGEFRNILLHNGLMILLDREEKVPCFDVFKSPWPLTRKIYFNDFPDPGDVTFALGYEHFENTAVRLFSGGPFEVVLNNQGELLYQGDSLRRGNAAVSVTSSENKLLCSLIPKNIMDREKALKHAKNNHYFFEREKIIFYIKIYYHVESFSAEELSLNVQLQNIYGCILGKEIHCSLTPDKDSLEGILENKLGIKYLKFKTEITDKLDTGVYHLAVNLRQGNKVLYDGKTVFEVMSDSSNAVPPPVVSGLPFLYSAPNEVKYMETDAFDPWNEVVGADYEHYFSACCFYPDFGRRKRVWELTKLYNREWFIWLNNRTTSGDVSIEGNKDIIGNCDYINIPFENLNINRYDLWKYKYYKDEVIDILIKFFHEYPEKLKDFNTISIEFLEKLRMHNEYLPENGLVELVENCWNEWLEYFSIQLSAILESQYKSLKNINNKVKKAGYGPFPVYGSRNKSVYFMNYFGYGRHTGMEKYFDGFLQIEDYPFMCDYPISRGIFSLMTIKLYYPELKIFPEIYESSMFGCFDGAVADAHPPYGIREVPAHFLQKRIYECSFAAIWFKENRFHFWNDNGFHFRSPRKESVQKLINAWGNVLKHKPVKPIKTTCFLVDQELIANHKDYYEKNPDVDCVWKDVYNTAEEILAYSYGAAREAGLPAGFVTTLEDLKFLNSDIVDLLVIPPLNKISKEHIKTIRDLHKQGINLLGFENVCGLEDLFGVKLREEKINIRKIGISSKHVSNNWKNPVEYVDHKLCNAYYENAGASTVLAGAETLKINLTIPVLLTNETKWGKTALFNIPPTVVNRAQRGGHGGSYGRACISPIIKEASLYILKKLSKPDIKVEKGEIIAFKDKNGNIIVIIEDDSLMHSNNKKHSQPLVNIKLPNIKREDISCDKEFSIANVSSEGITVRVFLEKHESAILQMECQSWRN